MTYIAGAPLVCAGINYKPGDTVPQKAIGKLKANVVNNLLTRGRLRFVDESAPAPPPPEHEPTPQWEYRGSGWWVAPNGIKVRGPADRPPALTGAG